MRVGVNARTFAVSEPDGAVQASRRISDSLSRREGTEVILYGNPDLSEEFSEVSSVNPAGFHSDSPFYGVLWERTVLPISAYRDNLDVLLCPNGNAPLTPVGCPIVTYVHDVNALRGLSSGIHGIYRRTMVPLGIRNSDSVVTVSEFSKDEIVNQLPVESDNVSVVYNGVDEFYLQSGGAEPLDLPEEYILYVGAMNPRKNVERLVKAFNSLKDDIDHHLVLVGPENKSEYQDMDVEPSSRVLTPGFIPKSQLKYAYQNASVFAYPSLYEGFGIPPLESMACGTPVVASTAASLPEILENKATLVDPMSVNEIATAIYNIVKKEMSEEEKEDLRRYANQFTWEKAGEELADVLQTVSVETSEYKL